MWWSPCASAAEWALPACLRCSSWMPLRVAVAIALGFFVAGEPAFACLYPPPPLKLPGEAEEAWKKRATEQLNAHIQEAHRATEAKYFVQAHAIYFARIIRSEEIKVDGTPYGR